jgi:diaminopimelate decarboxylase
VRDVSPWWARDGLDIRDRRLRIAGRDAEALARELGTPRYVFDLTRIREQAEAVQDALASERLTARVRFALKACREPEVLAYIRGLGEPGSPRAVDIDACTPREVALALASGWLPSEISLTGTNLTDDDLREALAEPVHINVDLLSQLRRVGRLFPGRRIGLRVNPGASAVRDGGDLYSGDRPTKFGIYPEDLDRAVEIAGEHQLRIGVLHCHIGWAYRDAELEAFEQGVEALAAMTERLRAAGHDIEEVNVGGGLGVPYLEGEEPLDLERWAAILARHLGPLGVTVDVEPGEFLVKEAGVLLAEVVTVEERQGKTFVGLNVGWNAIQQGYVYREPIILTLCRAPTADPKGPITLAGNINEGDDLFAIDEPFPQVEEGDIVAMLAVGAYNQAMANEHTLRPRAAGTYFEQRT